MIIDATFDIIIFDTYNKAVFKLKKRIWSKFKAFNLTNYEYPIAFVKIRPMMTPLSCSLQDC